jgi:hypothetical protein
MSDPLDVDIAKLVALVDKAVARMNDPRIKGGAQDGAVDENELRQARDELWVAVDWINRRNPEDRTEYLSAIFEDQQRAYLFTTGALLQCATLEAQIVDIQDGIPWEAEGETFQAFTQLEIKGLKGEVVAQVRDVPRHGTVVDTDDPANWSE